MSIFRYLKYSNISELKMQKFGYSGRQKILFRINVPNTIQFEDKKSPFVQKFILEFI